MSVAELKEYNDKNPAAVPPDYSWRPVQGGFLATCSYRGKLTHGQATNKKDAQREAALHMMKDLSLCAATKLAPSVPKSHTAVKAVKVSSDMHVSTEKAMRFLAEYRMQNQTDFRISMPPDKKIIDEDLDLGLKSKLIQKSAVSNADAIDSFKQTMKLMNIQFSCKVPEVKNDAKNHIVTIHFNYKYLTAGGIGSSIELATYNACENALNMIRVFVS